MNAEQRCEHVESTGNQKRQQLVRGALLVVLGAWMGMGVLRVVIYMLRTPNLDPWFIADNALRTAAALFFLWVGARAIRSIDHEVPGTKLGWGRLLLGIVLIYIQIRDHFVPSPNSVQMLQANETLGMRIARTMCWIAGVALILAAFVKNKSQAKTLSDTSTAQQQNLS
jgi:hypothetical protein